MNNDINKIVITFLNREEEEESGSFSIEILLLWCRCSFRTRK